MQLEPTLVKSASAAASLPSNVAYWRRGEAIANFGDYLTELLYARLFDGPAKFPGARIHLLGSVIAPKWIKEATAQGYERSVFWGCGMRNWATPGSAFHRRALVLGARGPLTRNCLRMPATTPLGDPALILPRIHAPRRDQAFDGCTICVPHILDTTDDATLLASTGADLVLRPNIAANESACLHFIDAVASARLVLAGALHAAIVAHAYGVPFAFFKATKIDVPFKWQDFAASIGFECEFVETVKQGMAYHDANRAGASLCSIDGLLEVAPFPLRKNLR